MSPLQKTILPTDAGDAENKDNGASHQKLQRATTRSEDVLCAGIVSIVSYDDRPVSVHISALALEFGILAHRDLSRSGLTADKSEGVDLSTYNDRTVVSLHLSALALDDAIESCPVLD